MQMIPFPNVPVPPAHMAALTVASDDTAVHAYIETLFYAAEAARNTAAEELEAACAKAARERVYGGGPTQETDATVSELANTIARLDGEIAFYAAALVGLE